MKQLSDKRAERPASHDDWTFRAEWAAGPDRDCRGDRLEQRYLRRNQAATEQDRLERFRNAVAANFLRPEARHQANDERTCDGRSDYPHTEVMMSERNQLRRKALKKDEVRDDRDNPEERLRHARADYAGRQRQCDENEHSHVGPEIAQQRLRCFNRRHTSMIDTMWGKRAAPQF